MKFERFNGVAAGYKFSRGENLRGNGVCRAAVTKCDRLNGIPPFQVLLQAKLDEYVAVTGSCRRLRVFPLSKPAGEWSAEGSVLRGGVFIPHGRQF
ncbi:MAG: hypothetical protein ACTTKL_05790 [Treponema sp.]